MIVLTLNRKESDQFRFLLPAKGTLRALELTSSILEKVEFNKEDNDEMIADLTKEEFDFILNMINILDGQAQLSLSSLSLIKKILEKKESNKNG